MLISDADGSGDDDDDDTDDEDEDALILRRSPTAALQCPDCSHAPNTAAKEYMLGETLQRCMSSKVLRATGPSPA